MENAINSLRDIVPLLACSRKGRNEIALFESEEGKKGEDEKIGVSSIEKTGGFESKARKAKSGQQNVDRCAKHPIV